MARSMVLAVGVPVRSLRSWVAAVGGTLRGSNPPVVLCYHGIEETLPSSDPHGLFVGTTAFADHLDLLLHLGYRLVTAGELWDRMQAAGTGGAAGLAAVTLDDGLADSLESASRLLAAHGGRGTAFVMPELLGASHPSAPDHRLVDAPQLRRLADLGVLEIGSHSLRHDDLRMLEADDVGPDLRRSRELLEELLERPVRGLAYPFGRYTPTTIAAAEASGYAYACACSGVAPWRRFEVPREPVFPSTSPLRLRLKAAGLYAPLTFASDRRNATRARRTAQRQLEL